MTPVNLAAPDFPHGTTRGYSNGCDQQLKCPYNGSLEHLSCVDAFRLSVSDYAYRRAIKIGADPGTTRLWETDPQTALVDATRQARASGITLNHIPAPTPHRQPPPVSLAEQLRPSGSAGSSESAALTPVTPPAVVGTAVDGEQKEQPADETLTWTPLPRIGTFSPVEVRAWAADVGIVPPQPPRGRIRNDVLAAWVDAGKPTPLTDARAHHDTVRDAEQAAAEIDPPAPVPGTEPTSEVEEETQSDNHADTKDLPDATSTATEPVPEPAIGQVFYGASIDEEHHHLPLTPEGFVRNPTILELADARDEITMLEEKLAEQTREVYALEAIATDLRADISARDLRILELEQSHHRALQEQREANTLALLERNEIIGSLQAQITQLITGADELVNTGNDVTDAAEDLAHLTSPQRLTELADALDTVLRGARDLAADNPPETLLQPLTAHFVLPLSRGAGRLSTELPGHGIPTLLDMTVTADDNGTRIATISLQGAR